MGMAINTTNTVRDKLKRNRKHDKTKCLEAGAVMNTYLLAIMNTYKTCLFDTYVTLLLYF